MWSLGGIDTVRADWETALRWGTLAPMVRSRARYRGIVQGVGFRPTVARLAARFPVTGFCGNDDREVFVEAQGDRVSVEAFFQAIVDEAPPLAHISDWDARAVPELPRESGFVIVASQHADGAVTLISPDVAVCDDCLADMADPANRRYRYPFTTCTNCGPRLSIIRDVPYDRPLTTMAAFALCPSCAAEYADPADRRYHAQPISCPDCGPTLWFARSDPQAARRWSPLSNSPTRPGPIPDDGTLPIPDDAPRFADAIAQARRVLADGGTVAVKGIGGYTLFCDATNEDAVARLRSRKRRPHKPFALMVRDLATARRLVTLSSTAESELTSPARPIVLAPCSGELPVAPSVAPGLDDLGVMLAYAPLHHLLVEPGEVYVATSANVSGDALIYRDDEALARLSDVVDAFLLHDRGIHVPVEDSVVIDGVTGPTPIRRSRGYAPLPIPLRAPDHVVLAVGAELKNTAALTRDATAFVTAHIGDMGSWSCQQAFEKSVAQLMTMHRRAPEAVVADLHPSYATRAWATRYARDHGLPLVLVQHHLAHALSLVAEHGITGQPLACAVADGTGYGIDGTIWGGEVLCLGADPTRWSRPWHLPTWWLPGGDSAVRHPWKTAVGLLLEYGIDPATTSSGKAAAADELALVRSQVAAQFGVVRTSSAGRLCDAVASLIGVRHTVTYEGQAAMELERLAASCPHAGSTQGMSDGHATVEDFLTRLVADVADGVASCCLAARFHVWLADLFADALIGQAASLGIATVGWTGGCAVNRLLTKRLTHRMDDAGLTLLTHRRVPCNDGGLSLGQALAGVLAAEGGLESDETVLMPADRA